MNNLFPWQEALWQQLTERLDTLSHGLLLSGPHGVGKSRFAEQLAALLLCENPGAFACGECPSCRLLASGNHPDYRLLTLAEDDAEEGEEADKATSRKKKPATQIKIDQVRGLEDFVFIGSHRRGRRVAVIDPAEAMNVAAANALLKMLEEPPAGVHFILVSSAWRRLMATLLSRCRQLSFNLPDSVQAVAWLRAQGVQDAEKLLPLAGGAPLAAAHWAQTDLAAGYKKAAESFAQLPADLVGLAGKWQSGLNAKGGQWTAERLVDALQKWSYDLQCVQLGAPVRYFVGFAQHLARLAPQTQGQRLARLQDELMRIRRVIHHPLNPQLMLEDMAARYLAIFSSH